MYTMGKAQARFESGRIQRSILTNHLHKGVNHNQS